MVLYKRKPIVLPDPKPLPLNIDVDVWHIDETGEWFLSYDEYLQRIDFYTRHFFTCEITGTSCLTFFQALDSEESQFRYVEEKFPLKLREPVARFLHFNEIRRLDALVEKVYANFKNDFFPGETVYLRKSKDTASNTPSQQSTPQPDLESSNGQIDQPQYQRQYIIKEKVQFNATIDPNTQEVIAPARAKYMLVEGDHGSNSKSFIADQSQIYRDRSTFTKHLIKCFFKITLQRASTKMGAPWCVKPEYLQMYGLTMDWPSDLLKYKDDEPLANLILESFEDMNSENKESKLKKDKEKKNANKKKRKELDNIIMVNQTDLVKESTSEPVDLPKKRKIVEEESIPDTTMNSVTPQAQPVNSTMTPTAVITQTSTAPVTSIMDDLKLPYQSPPEIYLRNLSYYNENLECIDIMDSENIIQMKSFGKLLEVYQFLNTFNDKLFLSYFNLDQFITTLKCSDPFELKGEVVYINKKENTEQESDWRRNSKIRDLIKARDNTLGYKIVKDDPASDEILDNINQNGTGLLLELYASLLNLFIDENGDWVVIVMEEWLLKPKLEQADNTELDERLEKCLNYRNVNWAERLTKRQYNNGFWLIILLGIFQDSQHIPKYSKYIAEFFQKVIPDNVSSNQLPKQLWRNYCRNLSLYEKLTSLWILVDLISNFSSDIKTAMEDAMDLSSQIRSERFKITKDLKAELTTLQAIDETNRTDEFNAQKEKIERLQKDKQFLDRKVMENNLQRLKPLGLDRYANKYYWLDQSGVHVEVNEDDHTERHYHTGRILLHGPTLQDALYYLQITEDQYRNWNTIAEKEGGKMATKKVFSVYRTDSGAFNSVSTEGVENELVNSQGKCDPSVELTPIQKKIIDEGPECLLLNDKLWYSIDRFDDFDKIFNWFDNWGRREHDLIRQIRPILDHLKGSYAIREKQLHFASFDDEEVKLFKQLQENELTEQELHIGKEIENGVAGTTDGPGESSEVRLANIEDKLEDIAEEIMKLDDLSSTRKVTNELKDLEEERDKLLKEKEELIISERPGARILARNERKRNKMARENKLSKQSEILTDLLNHRHFMAMEDVMAWKNSMAVKVWGAELRKNALGSKTKPVIDTIEDKLKEIIDHTSRTSTTISAVEE
ncbi:hypothetical protein KAFR_0K02380 [Kazachstania africana CBS 2517]|uniref:WAC domain-containing protein n=1 Tax=Kazachstania africana (strain ATCC 22294 / BCRC 22015 / CBS 2517 / CECT 1963 / NBRC 1671 / NRRL Y-8276) TaxID=1071382 RepID=H2B1U3_KAZAF|nr:hypothetical protein KAFR_0K02380 [Kazachstania africana CBS 2517]CCF60593.1 hypothetical protein KAFR_0K02380 [Kazachstania africana CBS 2517]